ncbi:MAG: hypothetical protein GY930_01760 [bacterium]|nr:hypothetical protein [bacterium]
MFSARSTIRVEGIEHQVKVVPHSEILPEGHGFISPISWITNAPVEQQASNHLASDSTRWSSTSWSAFRSSPELVEFEPGPYSVIDHSLFTRETRNIWGAEVLKWSCSIRGAILNTGEQYCFMLYPQGGGDAGYTVSLDGDYDVQRSTLTVRVIEKLWHNDTQKFSLRFKLGKDGDMEFVDALSE